MNITILGLGIMGTAMATNLIKTGNSITVWNRNKKKMQHIVEQGAKPSDSISVALSDADIFITMLSDPDSIQDLLNGDDGILASAKKNSLWINTSTVNPSFAKYLSEKAKFHGLRYLDAPVSGSKLPAEKKELIFLLGGSPDAVEEARPLLEAMGKAIHHLGEVGAGSSMKMVLNLLLGQAMLAFSEAMSLGIACGLSQEVLFNVVLGGPLAAPFLQAKRAKIAQGNFEPEFPLQHLHKDLHLALQTAYDLKIAMPLTGVAKEVYGMAKNNGLGELDISGIYGFMQGSD